MHRFSVGAKMLLLSQLLGSELRNLVSLLCRGYSPEERVQITQRALLTAALAECKEAGMDREGMAKMLEELASDIRSGEAMRRSKEYHQELKENSPHPFDDYVNHPRRERRGFWP